MRAFRPSQYAPAEECEEEQQLAKDANVRHYSKRAEAGLPLFEALPGGSELTKRSPDVAVRR